MNAPPNVYRLAEAERKSCPYGGGRFELDHEGIYYVGKNDDGTDKPPLWLCGRLQVLAKTRDSAGAEWGRLLQWADPDGTKHEWSMPMELLQSDGADVRRELARRGLAIAQNRTARELLAGYLQSWPTEDRARCVDRVGWLGSLFVTPAGVVGEGEERVVFQNVHAVEAASSVAGAVGTWRDSVATLCAGNSRLVFAVSAAFAPTLLGIVGDDSGGFHLRGPSSSGKSTALRVAASVWGAPDAYARTWRATTNGLEGVGAAHNDGLLVLDELSQANPFEVGEAAYMLGNGQGKARATRTGQARKAARWRLLFLSAGEQSLASVMARANMKTNAGQEIRMADIEADAGAGMGAFENTHGVDSPAAFARALKEAASTNYGEVGLEWLRFVVKDRAELFGLVNDGCRQFVETNVPAGSSGQVLRVARRFGLVAVAGELATYYGLTGWAKHEASEALGKCFASWLAAFGSADREEHSLIAQVRGFLEKHGTSRFENKEGHDPLRSIINRAGFFDTESNGVRRYYVLPEAFKQELCANFEPKWAAGVLLARGYLQSGGDGRPTDKPRLPGLGATRCYVITPKLWEDA